MGFKYKIVRSLLVASALVCVCVCVLCDEGEHCDLGSYMAIVSVGFRVWVN